MKPTFPTSLLMVLLLSGIIAPQAAQTAEKTSFQLDPAAVENLRLAYAPVEEAPIEVTVRGAGSVLLNEKTVYEITPKIDGSISEAPVSLGDTVDPGDILCTIQSAELAGLIANYVAAEEEMRFATAALEQEKKLAESQLTSKEMLREKENALTQAVTGHARALQPLKLLNFNEATIHAYLTDVHGSDYTTLEIEAMGKGEIIEMHIRKGAAVEHNTHLFTVADLSQLWVDFYVPLKSAPSLKQGDTVMVKSTVTEKERAADVIYVAPIADPRNRMVMVRALLSNEDGMWRPGNPVDVLASGSNSTSALTVPRSAVIDFGGGKVVFVRGEEGEFILNPIETGRSDAESVQVIEGLVAGQTVVSANAAQLKGHLEMTASE